MNPTAKTIQIFLPGGDPQGIRLAHFTAHIVQVIEVPRILLPEFMRMPESAQVALYFLLGRSEDGANEQVYIGQTGDLRSRLDTHNVKKEFWERALVLNSLTNNLTNTHTLLLEWQCIQAAKKAERYAIENGNGGSKPYVPAPLEADCREIFETGRTLLATLGFPLFDAIASADAKGKSGEQFHCNAAGTQARGLYTPEGFVVLKGSVGRSVISRSARTSLQAMRNRLVDAGVVRIDGDRIIFEKDHLFSAPSTASDFLTGNSTNGWDEWKSKDGHTLHELIRAPKEASAQ